VRVVIHADVKQAVTSWLQTFDTDLFYAGVIALGPREHKSLNVNYDCLENMLNTICYPCAMYTSGFEKTLSASGCLLPYN